MGKIIRYDAKDIDGPVEGKHVSVELRKQARLTVREQSWLVGVAL